MFMCVLVYMNLQAFNFGRVIIMKRISQAVVLIFFVSLLTGCDDKTTEPTFSLEEELAKLGECTQAQADALEDDERACIGTETNSQATESEIRAAINELKDRVESENRASCKSTNLDLQGREVVSYCMPPNDE